jgi:hypothetical protein
MPKKVPFPLPFINEVLNIVVGCGAYSFMDGYFGYHQFFIALEDRYKTTFVTNWGTFIWRAMLFRMKNGPSTFQKVVTKAFPKYLNISMKVFLYEFITYSDMEIHLQKLGLCFQKCMEYNINLNPKKCVFMVFSRIIFGFLFQRKINNLIRREFKQW